MDGRSARAPRCARAARARSGSGRAASAACASRGRCRSHRREIQKRSAAARISAGSSAQLAAGQRPHARRRRRRRPRRAPRRGGRCSRSMHQSFRHTARSNSKRVDAGEVEVEEAAQAVAAGRPGVEHHVVAEQVGVDRRRAAGSAYAGDAASCCWNASSSLEQRAPAPASTKGTHHRHRLGPPGQAAQVGLRAAGSRRPRRCMRASIAPTCAQCAASGARWWRAAQAVDHRGRLAVQRVQDRAGRRRPAGRAPGCRARPGASSGCR